MNDLTFIELGGKIRDLRRYINPAEIGWSAFNPSIAYSPVEGYAILFRSSNYIYNPKNNKVTGTGVGKDPGLIENRLWFAYLNNDLEIIEESLKEVVFPPLKIPLYRGCEDGRLFWRDGWEFTITIFEPPVLPWPRIGRFKLENYEANILNFITAPPKGKEFQEVEKNWMPTEDVNPKFDYIYSQTSVYSHSEGIVKVRDMPKADLKLRGGSQLVRINPETYIAIVHEVDLESVDVFNVKNFSPISVVRHYYHRFAKYNSDGILSGVSDRFKFSEFNIEFACGMIVKNNSVVISYGINDCISALGEIELDKVLEMIKDV